jgi:hypothetical protein
MRSGTFLQGRKAVSTAGAVCHPTRTYFQLVGLPRGIADLITQGCAHDGFDIPRSFAALLSSTISADPALVPDRSRTTIATDQN